MACQMEPAEVIIELTVIVVELLTEIAPWMRKYFATFLGSRVSMLDMRSQWFQMVDTLLLDEHTSSFEAYFAECFLMSCFQMAP